MTGNAAIGKPLQRTAVKLNGVGSAASEMGNWKKVLVLEVEAAKDKNASTPGGKYRRDTPWLVEAFRKKGIESDVLFITNKDSAASLVSAHAQTAFLGRVNPMDYDGILSLNAFVNIEH